MKKLLSLFLVFAMLLAYNIAGAETVSAEEVDISNCTNIALGKTAYGGTSLYGSGDSSALTNGSIDDFTINNDWYGRTDVKGAFVVDLGDDYDDYNVKMIEITTDPESAWTATDPNKSPKVPNDTRPTYARPYTAYMMDGLINYNPSGSKNVYFLDANQVTALGGVYVGGVDDYSDATLTQTTYKFPVDTATKRYVYISHDFASSHNGVIVLSEIKVWAERKPEEVDISNCTNIALGKTAYGGTSLYGSGDSSAGVVSIKLAGFSCVGISGGNIERAGVGDLCDYKVDNLMDIIDIIL